MPFLLDMSWFCLLYPLLACIFTIAATSLLLPLLRRWVLDQPNARSNHAVPVPRGGGLGMMLAALVFFTATGAPPVLLGCTATLMALSWLDDKRGVPALPRLMAQALGVAVALPIFFSTPAFQALPHAGLGVSLTPLLYVALALGWLWIMNLTNFMDGIDGITSLQTIAVGVGVCLVRALHPSLPLALAEQASILAAAALGFYGFNRSPARVFLGDVGSIPLGFLTGYLLLSLALYGEWAAALLLPAYYFTDASVTLLARLWRRQNILAAHSEHAYQRAVRGGLSHQQTTARIACLNALLVALALLASGPARPFAALCVGAGYGASALLMRHFMRGRHALPVR